MSPRNVKLVFLREVRDQLRDRRTLFMIVVLPLLLYPSLGIGMFQMMTTFREQPREVVILGASNLPDAPGLLDDDGIRTKWFTGGEADASKLRILHDLAVMDEEPDTTDDEQADENPPTPEEARVAAAAERRRQLLDAAKSIRRTVKESENKAEAVNLAFRESGIDVLVLVPHAFADGLGQANNAIRQGSPAPTYPGPVVILSLIHI